VQVGDLLTFGDLVIDQDAWEVRLRGAVINFTRTEFELLLAIASRPGVS
jgi:DNA-binding response OmpR family regulator